MNKRFLLVMIASVLIFQGLAAILYFGFEEKNAFFSMGVGSIVVLYVVWRKRPKV